MTKDSTPGLHIYGLFCACSNCRRERPGEIRYVGQTRRSTSERLWEHRKYARSGKSGDYASYRWMRKHGPENVRLILLDTADSPDDLNALEAEWIIRLGTFGPGPGLNSAMPPDGAWTQPRSHNAKLTDEQVSDIKIRIWNGESAVNIARELSLSNSQVFSIKSGRSYASVPWPIGPWRESTGHADALRKAREKRWSPEQHQKFQEFLTTFQNPFRGATPESWKRASKLSLTKLKIRDIRRIRTLRSEGFTYPEITDQMPDYVTRRIVSRICNGTRWQWVE